MLTCCHVVDIEIPDGLRLAVEDIGGSTTSIERIRRGGDASLDLAFLETRLDKTTMSPLQILTPRLLKVGEDVYSYGFFAVGHVGVPEAGYFGGRIVSFTRIHDPRHAGLTLPFAVLEGMSGSPILTYHGGVKVVGLAAGNRQSRVLVSETVDVTDGNQRFRETINRVVEHGIGYHARAIIAFLSEVGVTGFKVSG